MLKTDPNTTPAMRTAAEEMVRAIAEQHGATDVRLVVTPLQYEDFKAAGLPESMMVLYRNFPRPAPIEGSKPLQNETGSIEGERKS